MGLFSRSKKELVQPAQMSDVQKLSYIRAVDGKEKLLIDAKTKTYEFMAGKLKQTDPAKRRDYEDLAEVIETPEFESVLVGLTERARAQEGVRSGSGWFATAKWWRVTLSLSPKDMI